jgi:hypothetical protein
MDGLKKTDTDEFLSTMRTRFSRAEEEEEEIRKEARLDLRFVAGDQWRPSDRAKRDKEGRPCLTFNFLPGICQQVSNEAREQKPSVKFGPVDSGADIDTAKVQEGMARAIQRRSHADVAYENAFDYSTCGSFGAFRLATEYCSDKDDYQEIRYEPIMDPFTCYGFIIPAIMRKKARFGFVVEYISKEEYKATYPDSELVSDFDAGAQIAGSWIGDDIRIAEYWYTEETRETRPLKNGKGSRVVTKTKVFSCLTNGVEILPDTKTEWMVPRIPVYMVLGPQKIVDGKPHLFSLVRFLRDPQQLINAYKSGIAENIGLSNRVPYIGPKGSFKDPKWRDANIKNYAYLEYEPQTIGGQFAPPPQRQQFEAAIQGLSLAASQEMEDLKWISSVFDAARGAESNEKSGIAIRARKAQTSLANLHFIGNLGRAQIEAGEDLGNLIPLIYDTEQEVRIIGEDETERIVKVNAPYIDPETGKPTSYMLESGKFDITVEIGPTTDSQREEAAELVGQAIQAAPDLMTVMGDVLFRFQDGAGSQEIADRLKKFIQVTHPGLIEDKNNPQQQIPPQVQQQLQQSGQMIEQLTQHVNVLSEEIKTKKFELDSRERMHAADLDFKKQELDVKALLEHEKMGSTEAIAALDQRLSLLQSQIDAQNAAGQQAAQHQHEADQAAAAQAAAQQEQPAEPAQAA